MLVSIDFSYFFYSFLASFPQAFSIVVMFTGVIFELLILVIISTSVFCEFLQ